MPVHNAEIANIFGRYAALLEIEDANPFRVRAYRNAARTIQDLPQSVATMLEEGADLSELPGIGHDLAGKIKAIVETGTFADLDKLEKKIPGALAELVAVPGLGPKRVRTLYRELTIASFDDLRDAAKAGQLRKLPGFGDQIEKKILKEVERRAKTAVRYMLFAAEQVGGPLLRYLQQTDGVGEAVIAGSYRRRKETIGDLDILVTAGKGSKVMDRFVGYDDVEEVIAKGKTRSTVRLHGGLQVDLRVVPRASYGAALLYFTGSKAHNIATRTISVKKGLKLNEYGLFKGGKRVAGRSEKDVYAAIGLPFIEPELREDRGEIEAARSGRLPKLIALADIRGDLHSHTKASDGKYTAKEMAVAAKECGYDYLAISDHTKHVTIAHGLDARRLAMQIEEIDKLNDKLKGIRLLKAAEVDILEDGSLDLPDSILKDLDFTVCAIHYKFDLSRDKQTERIVRAMDNRHFNVFAHPTGRLIGEREPYPLDMERLIEAALERGCFLELNAQPERLDLSDLHAKMAKDRGLKVAICTDAHSTATLDYMRFGVDQARRAWLEPADVLNTRSWTELKKLLKRS
jgi:DNA polymerase (family 10)